MGDLPSRYRSRRERARWRALVRTLDEHAAGCPPAEALDIRLSLTDEALESLIGMAQLERLRTAFGSPHDIIKLRRVAATNQCVPFHCDYSKRTMQVALNAEHEYGGGKLTFATAHGFMQPARPRGSATTHVNSLVHGVSTLTHGVRYGLFLCDTKGGSVNLHYLIDASRAQFAFFEQALDLLDSASDTELQRIVREYAALLEKGAHFSSAPSCPFLPPGLSVRSTRARAPEALQHLPSLHNQTRTHGRYHSYIPHFTFGPFIDHGHMKSFNGSTIIHISTIPNPQGQHRPRG